MFKKKAIIILIGNNGTIVHKHYGDDVTSSFFENINDNNKLELSSFFEENKSYPIHVLLDTIDQTYRKKTYPLMKKSDLEKVANRDIKLDGDKDGLKAYIILKNFKNPKSKSKKTTNLNNKSECLFITSSKSEIINKWLNLLYEVPNRFVGIYMLPVETYNFFKKIVEVGSKNKKFSTLKTKPNTIFCLVVETKAGGARQIVFSNSNIVFTRVVNYNFNEANFTEKYSQDIYSTYEYLKRLYIDLSIKDFEVINIFPEKVNAEIARTKSVELTITGYTAAQACLAIGERNLKIENEYFDTIISAILFKNKEVLKFSNPIIKRNENIFKTLKYSYFINSILCSVFVVMAIVLILSGEKFSKKIDDAQQEKIAALANLSRAKRNFTTNTPIEADKDASIEKVGDFGRVEELLSKMQYDFVETYSLLRFSSDSEVKFSSFNYNLDGFVLASIASENIHKKVVLSGKLYNKTGDIENLFTQFDAIVAQTKKSLPNYEVKYNELPRTIDFNMKYFDFPIEFTIISAKK